jgi:hypothetical protein
MIPQVPKNARIRHSRFSGSSKKSAHDFRDLKKKRSRFFGSPISRFWVSGYPSGGGVSPLRGVRDPGYISKKRGRGGWNLHPPSVSPPHIEVRDWGTPRREDIEGPEGRGTPGEASRGYRETASEGLP